VHLGLRQDTAEWQEIQAIVHNNNLQAICDFREPAHNIVDYYNAADALVLSSQWEGLPNVLIEAMACNCIVLAADSADNDEIVSHGVNGFRFGRNDYRQLASELEDLMRMSTEQKSELRKQARESVKCRFSVEQTVRGFEALYAPSRKERETVGVV